MFTMMTTVLDYRSMRKDHLEEQFERDIKNAQEIIASEWQRRTIWSKLTEKLSWTIEYWL